MFLSKKKKRLIVISGRVILLIHSRDADNRQLSDSSAKNKVLVYLKSNLDKQLSNVTLRPGNVTA